VGREEEHECTFGWFRIQIIFLNVGNRDCKMALRCMGRERRERWNRSIKHGVPPAVCPCLCIQDHPSPGRLLRENIILRGLLDHPLFSDMNMLTGVAARKREALQSLPDQLFSRSAFALATIFSWTSLGVSS
jgi:hypothetical protein